MGTWKVADVMTPDAMSVDEQAPFKAIVDIMEAFGYNALPVVDPSGRVLGLVSSADLVPKIEFAGTEEQPHLFEGRQHRTARDKAAGTAAAELMTSPAVTVLPQTTLVEAAKIMESAGLKRLPVVDEHGHSPAWSPAATYSRSSSATTATSAEKSAPKSSPTSSASNPHRSTSKSTTAW